MQITSTNSGIPRTLNRQPQAPAQSPEQPKKKSTTGLQLPPNNRYHWDDKVAKRVRLVRNAVLPLAFRMTDEGFENIPKDGNFILSSTHQGMPDAVLASRLMDDKPFGAMADINQFKGIVGKAMSGSGAFPVDRYKEYEGDFPKPAEHAKEILNTGESFLLYPEGRIFNDDRVHPFQPGVGKICVDSNVKYALPVAHDYRKDREFHPVETGVGVLLSAAVTGAGLWAAAQGGLAGGIAGALTGLISGAVLGGSIGAVYFGNRNWHPLLADTLRQMSADGVKKSLAFFTSAFSSYSGCRQYRENILEARVAVGDTAPEVDKLRAFWNHPGFLGPMADSMRAVYAGLEAQKTAVLFTAHSIPNSMAENCRYEQQLQEACRLVAEQAGVSEYELDYQSRSGSPQTPWLEPDVCDRIRQLAEAGKTDMVVLPIGFISDHMEVLYDLDTEALELCQELGVRLHRLPTVGTHPEFVKMIVELVRERCGLQSEKRSLGSQGPSHDVCPSNCCLAGAAPRRPAQVPSAP